MKKKLRPWLWGVVPLVLLAVFLSTFIAYSQPMDSQIYDLSLYVSTSEVDGYDVSEQLGWTVYTQSGGDRTVLTPDGLGCFQSLDYPGQTFYYSRVMQETLDAPTIQLATANYNFSVFLDGELIYTDCPEQDNRIGYLSLPTREWDRKEYVTVSLPEDYIGKTLTIAQSTPENAETPRMATRALPTSITLYCSYAYESALIAESFQTACFGAVGYAMGALILVVFIRQVICGKADVGLLCLSFAVFLLMSSALYSTSYTIKYFGDVGFVSRSVASCMVMLAALLVFLSSRAGRLRWLPWALTALYTVAAAVFLLFGGSIPALHPAQTLISDALQLSGGAAVLTIMVMGWLFWRKENRFYRCFTPLASILLGAGLLAGLLMPTRSAFLNDLLLSLKNLTLDTLIQQQIAPLLIAASLTIVLVEFVRDEVDRHTEKQLIIARGEAAQQSYENLHRHHEEVMMLRHDMNRHFLLLRQMTTDEKAAQYLDELIGQNQKIRPIVQTGNEILDVILCSRLTAAADKGLRIDIVQADAPAALPLTDTDLCSLVMNLIDNAIAAAETSGAQQPFIRIDMHLKNTFFVFICENSTDPAASADANQSASGHGLGLRIVRQIARRHGNIIQHECLGSSYRVSLAIPLDAQ